MLGLDDHGNAGRVDGGLDRMPVIVGQPLDDLLTFAVYLLHSALILKNQLRKERSKNVNEVIERGDLENLFVECVEVVRRNV
jgi:hypothetical protein